MVLDGFGACGFVWGGLMGGVFGFVVAGVVRWFLGCLIVLYL